jgi:hypothetical protein
MARGLTPARERREAPRVDPRRTQWHEVALLRPGQEVLVVNLSPGGALLESPTRMSPGARAELHLFGAPRLMVRGRVDRCEIVRLQPLL